MAETVVWFGFPEPVEEPEVRERVSQDCVFEAVQLRVPPPAFQIDSVRGVGFDPPPVALKDNVVGLHPIIGAPVVNDHTGPEVELPQLFFATIFQ